MRINRGFVVFSTILASLAMLLAFLTFLSPGEVEALHWPTQTLRSSQSTLFLAGAHFPATDGVVQSQGAESPTEKSYYLGGAAYEVQLNHPQGSTWASGCFQAWTKDEAVATVFRVSKSGTCPQLKPMRGSWAGCTGQDLWIDTSEFYLADGGYYCYDDNPESSAACQAVAPEATYVHLGYQGTKPAGIGVRGGFQLGWSCEGEAAVYDIRLVYYGIPPALPSDQTWTPCDCPVGCTNQTQNWAGGPINTRSGNYHYSREDISIPALGGPLRFERSYNAAATGLYTEPLSSGWTHNYDMNLTFPDDPGGEPGTTIVRGCRGSRFRFEDNGDGSFDPLPGVWATLTRTLSAPYTYTLIGVDQSRYLFDHDGRLVEVLNPQDQGLTLEYDQGRLSRVEDSTGERFLTFEYDAAGRLEVVRDPISRTVQYGYDINGDLAVVTDTRGNAWTYSYSGTTHLLRDVVDPLGHVVERTEYDDDGRAVRQWDGELGQPLSINYGVDGTVTITDPLGHVSVDEYNSWGVLVGQRDAAGSTSRSYDSNLNWTTTTDAIPPGGTEADGNAVQYIMNAMGLPERVTDALGNATIMRSDAGNHLTATTDALGYTTRYAYQDNLLATVTDALNGTVVNSYDGRGLLIQAVDHGITTTFGYNNWGQVIAITDALGHVTTYDYDPVGRLVTTTNPAGQVTVNEYDDGDNLVRVMENLRPGHPQNHQNRYNIVTEYGFDAAGKQVAMTDTLDYVTRYEYDNAGRLVRRVLNYLPGQSQNYQDQYNLMTEYGYDGAGNQVAMTDTLGHVTRSWYDEASRLIRSTANYSPTVGANHENAWNLNTWYGYDAAGNQIAMTDTLGYVTRYEYDAVNRLVATTDPLTGTTRYEYDALGNQTVITDPTGIATSFVYDALGRVTQAEDALGQATVYAYDPAGNLATMTTPDGVATRYEYDALSRLIAVTENYSPTAGAGSAVNVRTVYGYDALGYRTVITDANGHAGHFVYDTLGQLVSESDPLGHTTEYGYDALGHQTVITDADGGVTSYAYDALGRLTGIQYPDSSISYAYDPLGNRLTMTDTSGVTTYTFDPVGRPITITAPAGTVGYRYDALGRRTHLLYPGGQVVTTTYDANGRVTQTADWDGGVTAHSYDAAGRTLETTLPNGITTTYGYDSAGHLMMLRHEGQHWPLAAYTYTLDAVGNRIAALERVLPPTPHVYEPLVMRNYSETIESMMSGAGAESTTGPLLSPLPAPLPDGSGTLLSPLPPPGVQESNATPPAARVPVTDLALMLMAPLGLAAFLMQRHRKRPWAWPAVMGVMAVGVIGLWAAMTLPGGEAAPVASVLLSPVEDPPPGGGCSHPAAVDGARAVSYVYDPLGRLVEAADSDGGCYRYDYDPAGNRVVMTTTLTTHSYSYDAADQLTAVEGVTYTHDDRGNLVSNGTLTYTHNNAGRMVSVAGGATLSYTYNGDGLRVGRTAGGSTTGYTWDLAADLPQMLGDGENVYVPGVGYHDGERWTYTLADGLGSVRQWADEQGYLVGKQDYSLFGKPLTGEGERTNPLQYTGEYYDEDLGLVYLRARWYDPSLGRFLSRDPFPGFAILPQTQHDYVYVGNNPVNLTDPGGEFAFIPLLLVGAAGGLLGGVSYYTIQQYIHMNPCTGMEWDWREAALWGGAGTGIGALLGAGIYGGGWIWTTYGPTVASTVGTGGGAASIPLSRAERIVYWRQMHSVFLQAYPRLKQFVGMGKMAIHHRIPLQWAHLFPNVDPNRLSNLYAVPQSVHQTVITPLWNAFARANPTPTAADVMRFAVQVDQRIAEFINRIPN